MYPRDHNPPHFHAEYAEYEALVAIETLELIKGHLPSRIFGFVMEWAVQHKQELMENWKLVNESGMTRKIAPLV